MQRTSLLIAVAAALLLTFAPIHAIIHTKIVANRQSIMKFCQTANVKIAFIGRTSDADQYLYYINYNETTGDTPAIHKIASSSGASSPSISTDGKMMAYNAGSMGTSNASIYVTFFNENARSFLVKDSNANEPRFAKRTDSTIILYTSTWTAGDWAFGKTKAKYIIDSTSISPEYVIESSGSYHGGLSGDNRYLASTQFEPNPRMMDRTTSTVHTLHRLAVKNTKTGSDTIVNPQACNCSITSSRIGTDVMLYLDYGLPENMAHPVLGTWEFHKRIFVSNSKGTIVTWYDFPDSLNPVNNGSVTGCCWTHTEWSVNHPYFGVAGNITSRAFLVGKDYENTDNCEDIYIINLKNHSYLKVLESRDTSVSSTTNIEFPSLWIEIPNNFVEDSSWLSTSIVKPDPKQPRVTGCDAYIKGNIVLSKKPIKRIAVIDMSGRIIETHQCNKSEARSYTLSHLKSNGLYLIAVTTEKTETLPLYYLK